jgi:hypothetical protein
MDERIRGNGRYMSNAVEAGDVPASEVRGGNKPVAFQFAIITA